MDTFASANRALQREQEMKFGTQITPDGVRFRLWAPGAKAVSVKIYDPPQEVLMQPQPRDWERRGSQDQAWSESIRRRSPCDEVPLFSSSSKRRRAERTTSLAFWYRPDATSLTTKPWICGVSDTFMVLVMRISAPLVPRCHNALCVQRFMRRACVRNHEVRTDGDPPGLSAAAAMQKSGAKRKALDRFPRSAFLMVGCGHMGDAPARRPVT
jgi:hypothetical protein